MKKKISLFICFAIIFTFAANIFAESTISDVNSLGQYIYTNMQNHITPITVHYTNSADITPAVGRNILSGAYIKDDYTAASYSDITFREKTSDVNKSTVDLTITPTYVETADQEAYVNKRVSEITSSVIKAGMTDYQKVAALHDWVVSNVKYDTSLQDVSDYAALTEGKTVCRGYSMLLYKLLTNAGFNSHIVIGEAVSGFRFRHSAEGHAWNMVQLNGNWYFIDATNDQLSGNSSTKFFLVSGTTLQQNGFVWDKTKYPSAPANYGSSSPTTATGTVSAVRLGRLAYSTAPVTLSAFAVYSNGTRAVISNPQAAWASSNTGVATVDGNGTVSFTGASGNVTITATIGNITAKTSTNVSYRLGVTRISRSSNSQVLQMCRVYSDGVIVPVTSGVTWASSNTSVAAIDSNGNLTVTGTSGVAAITGTCNGQTISQQIITNTNPAASARRMDMNRFRSRIHYHK